MGTLKKARAVAAKYGGVIEVNQPFWPAQLDAEGLAPEGMRWREGGGLHSLVTVGGAPGGQGVAEAWDDLIARMNEGVEDCPPDCECTEEGP